MADNSELVDKLTKYLAMRIATDKKGGIADFATLLSAIAAALGAFMALWVAFNSWELQKQIDHRQILINENDHINSLYFKRFELGHPNASCVAIPVDDTNSWQAYHQCLFDLPLQAGDKLDFAGATDQKRFSCLRDELQMCREGDYESHVDYKLVDSQDGKTYIHLAPEDSQFSLCSNLRVNDVNWENKHSIVRPVNPGTHTLSCFNKTLSITIPEGKTLRYTHLIKSYNQS